MIVAHLSDLHLRDESDADEFARQLDRIVDRAANHLIITGDLLDRWNPALLERALDVLDAHYLLHRDRLTIIHGNHDIASSGGHPRKRSDLWRLITRFWDPPPLLAVRRREFYRRIESRGAGIGLTPAAVKQARGGLRLACIDSVPAFWMPVSLSRGTITLHHAEGTVSCEQTTWLSKQRGSGPLIVLIHHYPLPVGAFTWELGPTFHRPARLLGVRNRRMAVRMEIDPEARGRLWEALEQAGACAVLCGHVHRARLERHGSIAVGLNGQSGAAWAGRTIAYYRITSGQLDAA